MVADHPPAAPVLLEKGAKHRVLGKIAASLEAWREDRKATAWELLEEARAMMKEDLAREAPP